MELEVWKAILWACSVAGLPCAAGPDVSTIQAAYEREEASGSAAHDKQLKILDAKCHDTTGGQYLCEVTFMSNNDPDERLYFDIAAITRMNTGWKLASGLCKR
jgi:hypothetical protein